MPRYSASWSTSREGNLGHIEEVHEFPDGSRERYVFVVPASAVPAVVAARRRVVQCIVADSGGEAVDNDFSWMEEKEVPSP
jgi:hypothetical protein